MAYMSLGVQHNTQLPPPTGRALWPQLRGRSNPRIAGRLADCFGALRAVVNAKGRSPIRRMDIGFLVGIMFWTQLKSMYLNKYMYIYIYHIQRTHVLGLARRSIDDGSCGAYAHGSSCPIVGLPSIPTKALNRKPFM